MIAGNGYTSQGGMEHNEDAGLFIRKKEACCAVIADGLGGHGNGDKASRTAVEIIKKCFEALPEGKRITQEDMAEWFDEANQAVLAIQTSREKMKTTLAMLCIDEREGMACLAHLGDSRIYYFENGKCAFCTFDHSVSRMAVLSGEIEMKDIRFHIDRNKLLKAIGKEGGVRAETKIIPLREDVENVFLLCTDGFWEYVTEEEMEKTLALAQSPMDWIAMMRKHLEQCVKANNDNNSAIAVWETDKK